MIIREAQPGDFEPALAAMSDAFGLQLRAPTVHTLVAESSDGTLLVAERDGVVVGTAASVGFGPTGWLGGITVTPDARGNGVGRQLTEAAIDALGDRETILLLATPMGRAVYEKLGFEAEGAYRVFASGSRRPEQAVELRDLTPGDLDAVRALDRQASGEDRSLVLEASLEGAKATPDLKAVALRPPWPALPIIGDPAAATTLLTSLIEPGLRLAVPEENTQAVNLLRLLAREQRTVTRMRRGPAVDWRPDNVWGVFSLFFG